MPFSLHLSLCVAVPLVLAVCVSALLWDVLCFNCENEQRWRAAMMDTGKGGSRATMRTRFLFGPVDEPDEAVGSRTAQVTPHTNNAVRRVRN